MSFDETNELHLDLDEVDRLRHGDIEVLERVLCDLEDGDWFTDSLGRSWEWCYDIDANLHRWFIGHVEILRLSLVQRERKELHGAPPTFTYYGWGFPSLWRTDGVLGPYRRVTQLID